MPDPTPRQDGSYQFPPLEEEATDVPQTDYPVQ